MKVIDVDQMVASLHKYWCGDVPCMCDSGCLINNLELGDPSADMRSIGHSYGVIVFKPQWL